MSDQSDEPQDSDSEIIEKLKLELEAIRAERDKAVSARDALIALTLGARPPMASPSAVPVASPAIRKVLPLSRGALEPERRRARLLPGIIAIVLVGLVGGLLLQNWRALQGLERAERAGTPARADNQPAKRGGPAPASPSLAGNRVARWEIMPIPDLELLGRAALSPDGRRLAVAEAAAGGRVAYLDLDSGRVRIWRALATTVRDLTFTRDGQGLLCGGADGRLVLFEASTGKIRRQIRAAGATPIRALAVSREQFAVAGEGNTIELFATEESGRGGRASQASRRLSQHKDWVRALALDARGELLASGGHDGQVILWKLKSGERRVLKGHRVWISALMFSSDGSRLASGDWDGRAVVWDVASGKQLRTFNVSRARAITSLAFDSTGQQLASASLDRLVTTWDLTSGERRYVLDGNRWAVTWVGFTKDHLLSVGSDGTARRWQLPLLVPPVAVAWRPVQPGEVTLRNNTSGERLRLRLLDARGKPVPGAAARLAGFLRCGADDRRTTMDESLVRLLDRIAEHFGRGREIIVISGYRSPEYNHLRTVQSRGVAKESQHMMGTAIDLRVSGVTITKLRDVVKRWRLGGVGFYADSNFVHVDVGPVRTWNGE